MLIDMITNWTNHVFWQILRLYSGFTSTISMVVVSTVRKQNRHVFTKEGQISTREKILENQLKSMAEKLQPPNSGSVCLLKTGKGLCLACCDDDFRCKILCRLQK